MRMHNRQRIAERPGMYNSDQLVSYSCRIAFTVGGASAAGRLRLKVVFMRRQNDVRSKYISIHLLYKRIV